MKQNLKWLILGLSIITAAYIYAWGTRYQAIEIHNNFGGGQLIIYNRITGERK